MSDSHSEAPNGMQQLLEQEKEQGYKALRRGDVIEGVVMRVDKDGVLISLGLKSEGLVPAREMRTLSAQALARIRVGDRILATVIRGENEYGEVLLSVDQARSETGWRLLEKSLESGEAIEVEVTGNNKGGLL
ncbi:MAG: S1 RNA-binding domain-containing protein, partial [Chloroflexi bacterium]|nr:S1 RNA-binding domain-containing protein [Chloroflexota bacterium]